MSLYVAVWLCWDGLHFVHCVKVKVTLTFQKSSAPSAALMVGLKFILRRFRSESELKRVPIMFSKGIVLPDDWMEANSIWVIRICHTRILGLYVPLILAPVEGCWVGLWPISWAFGPITIQSMDDLGTLQGRYPENFVLISQFEVCQEGGVKKGDTWMTLSIPDWRHGGHGHS